VTWVHQKQIFKDGQTSKTPFSFAFYLILTLMGIYTFFIFWGVTTGYNDYDFQLDCDSRSSTLVYVFALSGGAISWTSVKQSCIPNSTIEAE
jgi:hypothetical protein